MHGMLFGWVECVCELNDVGVEKETLSKGQRMYVCLRDLIVYDTTISNNRRK